MVAFFCLCLFLRSKRISRWGQKKITEQPTRTRSKLFIYRISGADKRECAWTIRKGATALCLSWRSGVFCGPITIKTNVMAVCSRPLLKIAPLLQNDQVAFFFQVLRTGSVIKQNKQGKKKGKRLFPMCAKIFK